MNYSSITVNRFDGSRTVSTEFPRKHAWSPDFYEIIIKNYVQFKQCSPILLSSSVAMIISRDLSFARFFDKSQSFTNDLPVTVVFERLVETRRSNKVFGA